MNTKEVAEAINWLDGYIIGFDDKAAVKNLKALRKMAVLQLPKDAAKIIIGGNVWFGCDDCATLITVPEDIVNMILDDEGTTYCPNCGQRIRIPVEDEENNAESNDD